MKIAEAVANRTKGLLFKYKVTQYKLCKDTCLSRTGIHDMFHGKTQSVSLTTIGLIAQFFGMSLKEFFDDPIFDQENLEV